VAIVVFAGHMMRILYHMMRILYHMMRILYIDEAGDLGSMPAVPLPSGNDQPVLIIGGLIVDYSRFSHTQGPMVSRSCR
jgi:hypothetical protein